ncbi:hypothetical protein METBIDRAFT_76793 [Metschnikowia bicuspidata var. bicuspidata NRRL YB-4993]|uniref:Uncharacterized protein n=1 Tax=Metschnikowia bicuspidata var. bicuspidata NRRL YB-4993 TaxID=869754 RepID=A0A1A0HJ41_9ASCO|nr:hypothetical protein METBIDRAFT_76793 [Metschnikowia bicuspidata var. bicuspidata NRRL YB-4993]OBA23858.1 hypothetical protein METBIDRAFT_76793 [Metschnikowia bicuspidata var. bicuspidata NRRL YB-4993]
MPAYLNVETIRNAAELINSTLVTKGHISEDLKFVTTNWAELISDQPDKKALETLTVQEGIYNNDKNVVNAIYSLVQSIDKHNRQHEASNQVLAEKETEIARLQRKLHRAELETSACEKKLARVLHTDLATLTQLNEQLEKRTRAQTREILRLKNLNCELRSKYEVERRRMALESSELKSALLHSRGLSTAISYGRPMKFGSVQSHASTPEPDPNPHLVHGNKPSVNNTEPRPLMHKSPETSEIAKNEYEGIATQLLEVIEQLMNENGKFAKLTRALTAYVEKVNASIRPENVRRENGPDLASPAEFIDVQFISAETNEEVVPFELSSAPLLRGVYNNYDAIATLVDMAVNSLLESRTFDDQRRLDKMDLLAEENRQLSSSLQDALKALEEWRRHKKEA